MNLRNDSGVFDNGAPSLYFVGHSSFRIGYSAKFLEFFINSQRRTPLMILTDPKMAEMLLLAPFSSKRLAVKKCYLESNLTLRDASMLLEEIRKSNEGVRATTAIIPKAYMTNKSNVESISLGLNKVAKLLEYGEDDELHVDLSGSRFRRCLLHFEKQFSKMNSKSLFPGVKMYSIEGTLRLNEEDNYEALIKEAGDPADDPKKPQIYLNLLSMDKKLNNLTDEMFKLRFAKIYTGKTGATKKEEKIRAVYHSNANRTQVIITHNASATKIFFSEKSDEEVAINAAVKKALGLSKDNL